MINYFAGPVFENMTVSGGLLLMLLLATPFILAGIALILVGLMIFFAIMRWPTALGWVVGIFIIFVLIVLYFDHRMNIIPL